jgi:hypothetical protein
VAGSMALQPNGRLLVLGATDVGWDRSINGSGDFVLYGISTAANVTTSINNPELLQKLTIGPNPATDRVTIRYSGPNASLECSLWDASGKEVPGRKIFTSAHTILLKGQPAGTYVLKVRNTRTGAQVQTKIVKY